MVFNIKYFILCISVICVASDEIRTNILKQTDNNIDDLVKCIKNIASRYIPCGTLITLVNLNMHVQDLIKAITNDDCNSLIIKTFEPKDWLLWTDVYIITSRNKFEFISGIIRLRRDVMWNPKAKFIVQIQNLTGDDISELFNLFNNYKMYNVVLVRNISDSNIIYTYYPFSNGACSDHIQNAVTLGPCEDTENISEIFQNEAPDNIANCTFRVTAYEDIPNFISETTNFTIFGEHVLGIEQYLLSVIAEEESVKFQYTIKPQEETYGFVLRNGTATGLFEYLQDGSTDILAGGFVLIKNRIEMFDYIWGINYVSLKIFTPTNADTIWDDVYKEFNLDTWALILVIYCLIYIIFVVKRSTMTKTHRNRTYLALVLWGYLCGSSSSKLPKEKGMRIILVWWIWFTFFIVNFYTTTMYSLIARRVHVRSQTNADKLEELPYNPCIPTKTRTFLIFAYNKTLPEDKDNQMCKDSEDTLDIIASKKDLYTVDIEYAYSLNEYRYIDEDECSTLDSVDFYNQHTVSFYVNRGFPYTNKIDKYAKRMSETGLMKRHLGKILEHGQIVRHRRKKSFKTINIPDLIIHYCILLGGFALSLVVLCVEIVLHRKTM